jgi:saccharopine dehydrogenase (NAD+, L-lysine-forming)
MPGYKDKLTGSKTKIRVAQLDADRTEEVIELIKDFRPDIVINVALPYQT